MGATWQQWSAASLASGAVLLVLGSLMLPADGSDVAAMIASAQGEGGRWVMTACAFLLASVAMTLGLPTILAIIRTRGRRLGIVAVGVWAMGTIGLGAYAALLMFFRTMVAADALTAPEASRVADDRTMQVFVLSLAAAFLLGEALTGVALLYSRAAPRWVGALLLVHVATAAVAEMLPTPVERFQVLMFGVALMGVSVQASENWARVRRSATL